MMRRRVLPLIENTSYHPAWFANTWHKSKTHKKMCCKRSDITVEDVWLGVCLRNAGIVPTNLYNIFPNSTDALVVHPIKFETLGKGDFQKKIDESLGNFEKFESFSQNLGEFLAKPFYESDNFRKSKKKVRKFAENNFEKTLNCEFCKNDQSCN